MEEMRKTTLTCQHGGVKHKCPICDLEEEVAKLKALMRKHSDHTKECNVWSGGGCRCNCGYEDLPSDLKEG
jgi:hypothetical protein